MFRKIWDDDIIELTSQRFYESSIKKLVEDLSNNIMVRFCMLFVSFLFLLVLGFLK